MQPGAFDVLHDGCGAVDDRSWWIATGETVSTLEPNSLVQVRVNGDGGVQGVHMDVICFQEVEECVLPTGLVVVV